jgi:hypothetical protein
MMPGHAAAIGVPGHHERVRADAAATGQRSGQGTRNPGVTPSLAVLHRELDGQRVRFDPADRAWLAALLHPLPRSAWQRLRLLVRPDTILRWHRDLLAGRHAAASRPRGRGRPPTVRSIRAHTMAPAVYDWYFGYAATPAWRLAAQS